jgi:hypothetical protein
LEFGSETIRAPGTIDVRGRLTEDASLSTKPNGDVVAVTGKFAPRNPAIENALIAALEYPEDHIASSHTSDWRLSFPKRIATTVGNAKARPLLADIITEIRAGLNTVGLDAPLFLLKGNGALASAESVIDTPAHTLRGPAAAAGLGLLAFSRNAASDNHRAADYTSSATAVALFIDRNRTTIVPFEDGFVKTRDDYIDDLPSHYDSVDTEVLTFGSYSVIAEDGTVTRTTAPPAGIGGTEPTVADAAAVSVGTALQTPEEQTERTDDIGLSRTALANHGDPATVADTIIGEFLSQLRSACDNTIPDEVILGGEFADVFGPVIDRNTNSEVTVPPAAGVADAIGGALATVSVEVSIHIDTDQGRLCLNSEGIDELEVVHIDRSLSERNLQQFTTAKTKQVAARVGASDDPRVEITNIRQIPLVRDSQKTGQLIDIYAHVPPRLNTSLLNRVT